MFQRSALISSIALLAFLGAACDPGDEGNGRSEAGGPGFTTVTSLAAGGERPGAEFCELFLYSDPGTIAISETSRTTRDCDRSPQNA